MLACEFPVESMQVVSRRAPAKINLGLYVSGYDPRAERHIIRTVFWRIPCFDLVEIEEREHKQDGPVVEFCGWEVPPWLSPAGSSCGRLLKELHRRKFFRKPLNRLYVRIWKAIPYGGGLGGASADASALLALLESTGWIPSLSPAEKCDILLKSAGSDASVLALPDPWIDVSGTGTRAEPLKGSPVWQKEVKYLVLVVPGIPFSTPEMYAFLRNHPELYRTPPSVYPRCILERSPGSWRDAGVYNVFEEVARQKGYVWVQKAIRILEQMGAEFAGMTGSGSVLFALWKEEPVPQQIHDRLASVIPFPETLEPWRRIRIFPL